MNPDVTKLNEARRMAVDSGQDPYAGNLANASTFNSTISSSNLGGTPYKLPDTTVSTNAEGITGASQAVVDQQKVNDKLAQDTADKEAKATASENTIKGLFDQTTQLQQQRAEAEGDVNTPGTPANLKETARRATNALTVSQRAQTNELRALEGAGLTDIQRNQKSSEINRRYAFQQADLQLTAHLANSDYLAVEDTLNKKLELDLAPLKSQLDFQTQFYNNNRADLTKSEDRQLSQLINQTNQAVQTQEENKKAVNAALLAASQNGVNIPPNLFAKASNAKDVGELTQLLAANGISLQDPLERQLKQAQINSANRANQPKSSGVDADGNPVQPGTVQLAQDKANIDQISELAGSSLSSSAVGSSALTRKTSGFWNTLGSIVSVVGIPARINSGIEKLSGKQQNFIAGVEQLRSTLNLDTLIKAKANGATFGALSNQELQVLASSATKLGTWAIKDKEGNAIGYNTTQANFKKEMDKINNFAKLDYVVKGGDPADVGAKIMPDGTVWATNSDGTFTQIK